MPNIQIRALDKAIASRAADLAAASNEAEVDKIVEEAKAEAFAEIPNTKVYQLAVIFLGCIVVLAILAQAALVWNSEEVKIPEGLVAIGSLAIGALAGMLSPTASS